MWRYIETSRSKIAFVFLYVYVFVITFGILQRSYGNPSGFGLSSALMAAIIILVFPETVKAILYHKLLQMWVILIVYLLAITMIANPSFPVTDDAYKKIGGLFMLCLFCGAVASMTWNALRIRRIGNVMVFGLMIMGVMALLDDFKVLDISFMNLCYMHDPPIKSPNAQFGHRSIMGLYLGIMLPFLFVLEDSKKQNWFRFTTIAVGICFLYFLIYSANRSGIAAATISLTLYYAFHLENKERLLNPYVPGFAISIILSFVLVFWTRTLQGLYFLISWLASPIIADIPVVGEVAARFAAFKLNQLQTIPANVIYASDRVRYEVIQNAVSGFKTNFFGAGFQSNTHVWFIIDIIFAAGVVGVIWISISSFYVTRVFSYGFRTFPDKNIIWALLIPLVSWVFVGIMYNSLHIGLAWLFLGIVLALCSGDRIDNMKPNTEKF